jgi:type I restriction enzyme S subunit
MAGEWIECSLADACSSIDYGLTASASDREAGPRFLRITDIVTGHIDWSAVPHVAADEATASKYRLHDGDVVLARTGASTGASAYVQKPPPAVFASYLVRLKAKPQFDARFLAYYLRSEDFWTFIRGVLGDKSAQPNASASTMTKAPLRAPKDKDEQRAIAHILGTLDDKIELNRRMNETLEAMARALFKSWFVDFDPVRAKAEGRDPGLPKAIADLFPDRFVDSELGEIPEGWGAKGLDEIARFLNGLALQKYPPSGDRWLPVIKIAQLRAGNTAGADRASTDLEVAYIVQDGDLLFSWSGSLECVLWAGGPGALNQHIFKVTSDGYPKWFCYLAIHQHLHDFRRIAAGKATTMGHIQRHHLSEAKIAVPPPALLRVMNECLAAPVESLWKRNIESRTLAEVRDSLLPKLISGELRLKDGAKYIGVAV